jgi:hypothetical protein
MARTTLEFDWRVTVSDDVKTHVKLTIQKVLDRYQGLSAKPQLVIVSRPAISPTDQTILADIRTEASTRIGTVTITEGGRGRLYFAPAHSGLPH